MRVTIKAMFSVAYVEWRYCECRFAECCGAQLLSTLQSYVQIYTKAGELFVEIIIIPGPMVINFLQS
jgi:hypothetical protein